MRGCDYSWDRPSFGCLWDQGARFIVRYGSRDPGQAGKNLTKSELNAALDAGFKVAVVWQDSKNQMQGGYSAGQSHAKSAVAFFDNLGLNGIPIYFSCDQDYEAASSSVKGSIDAFVDGARSIVGLARNGGYGDDSFCKKQFDRGAMTWGWQTYAWSEGDWDDRAQLRQVQNDVTVCGCQIDWDESRAEDFGQWPRPAGAPAAGGVLIKSGIAFDPNTGTQVIAYINQDGRVCCNGGLVDAASNARSGVGLAISENGRKVITYTNSGGKLCTYTQEQGSGEWAWADKQWKAK